MLKTQSQETIPLQPESWPYKFLWTSSDTQNFKALSEADFDAFSSSEHFTQNTLFIIEILEKIFEMPIVNQTISGQMCRSMHSKTRDRPDRVNIRINYSENTLRLIHGIICHTQRSEKGFASWEITKSSCKNVEEKWKYYSDILCKAINDEDSNPTKIFVPASPDEDWLLKRRVDTLYQYLESTKEDLPIQDAKNLVNILRLGIERQNPNTLKYLNDNYSGFIEYIIANKPRQQGESAAVELSDTQLAQIQIDLTAINAGIDQRLIGGSRYSKLELTKLREKCFTACPKGSGTALERQRNEIIKRFGYIKQ
jgi:hypothetical protein